MDEDINSNGWGIKNTTDVDNAEDFVNISLPFLGILQYYLEKNDLSLIKKALTELYSNLSYITISGAKDFDFTALSDIIAKSFFLLKAATRSNIQDMDKSDIQNSYNINKERLFASKK